MMKLTSRVKRRDEQVMKKRGSLSGEREDGKKKDSREGLPKNIPKKSEDNYREVFPQVKLWFDSETPRNPRHSREELESEPSLQIAMISSREPELYSTAPDTTKTAHDQLANTQPMSGSLLICATPESPPKASSKETPLLPITGMPCVRNKDNDGNVIVDGRPFWYQKMEEDLTDEGNVLNAAVILEVASGNLSLVNMPDEPIELDVYGEWKELRSRDATCFNKDVLFGNTIRSMVNLFEESVKSRGRKKHDKEQRSDVVSFILPEMVVFYMDRNKLEQKLRIYANNMRKLIITARKQIKDLKQENTTLKHKLESSGLIECPACLFRFKPEKKHRVFPKYVKVFRGKLALEMEFQSLDDLTKWLTVNQLDEGPDGVPTMADCRVQKLDLTSTGSVLHDLVKEEEKKRERIVISTRPRAVPTGKATRSVRTIDKSPKRLRADECPRRSSTRDHRREIESDKKHRTPTKHIEEQEHRNEPREVQRRRPRSARSPSSTKIRAKEEDRDTIVFGDDMMVLDETELEDGELSD
ncbi:hypothetical protein Q1695_008033 [Nippostrongylus brasiliensis]|nr:hypothetical protein Q1695_008033 [Nippostrongylus brasiliensis]